MKKWILLLLAGAFLMVSVQITSAQEGSEETDEQSYTRGALFGGQRRTRSPVRTASWRSSSTAAPSRLVRVSGGTSAIPPAGIVSSTIGGGCGDGGCESGCDSSCAGWTDCSPKCGHPCVGVFGDFLYMTARNVDVPLAAPFNGATLAAAPVGTVAVADPHYTAGFRAGGSVFLSNTSAIEASFAWLDSNTSAQFDAPQQPAMTAFRSFIFHPTTNLMESASQTITSRYDIDFRFIDVAYKGVAWQNRNGYIGYLAGVRYAHIDQDLYAQFAVLGDRFVESRINFDGVGPRIGIDGEYRTQLGLFGYTRGTLNVLAGHFGGLYRQQDANAGTEAFVEYGDDRIVLNPEVEIGVGWSGCNGRVRVSGGYYVSAFYNSMTTPGFIQATQTNNYNTSGDNNRDVLTFDGLVARIEVRY